MHTCYVELPSLNVRLHAHNVPLRLHEGLRQRHVPVHAHIVGLRHGRIANGAPLFRAVAYWDRDAGEGAWVAGVIMTGAFVIL